MALDSPEDRRMHFAEWLTSKDNLYFQRAIVNRVWGNFMGRGIVDPVDDVRATNPASNEDLFRALCKDFVDHGLRVKHLVRTIMNSAAYQLSAEANATNTNDNKYYSKYIVKRLPAEVLLDAMSQVTGVPTQFSNYPAGMRALQLPDTQVKSEFLASFGRPPRILCDAAERTERAKRGAGAARDQRRHVESETAAPDAYPALAIKLGLSDSRILDHLFLSAYSRYPSEAEKQPLLEALRKARAANGSPDVQREARRQALEDMMWAMLTSKEFLFNY